MEALAAVREIKNAYGRAKALKSIAHFLANAGMATEAHETMAEALAVARKIKDADDRANALIGIVDFWLEQGRGEMAGSLINEVRSTISRVFEDDSRSEALRDLAVILARLYAYRAARETAEQCSSTKDRLAAYTAILREYYIERDPSLVRLFAEEIEEEEDDLV